MEEVANGVLHPVNKETIFKYKPLVEDPLLLVRETWQKQCARNLKDSVKASEKQKGQTQ